MSHRIKEQLKTAFDPPIPVRKNEFIQQLQFQRATRFDFITGQIGYIRKRVWLASLCTVAAAIVGLRFYTDENGLGLMWLVSSILPFIALVGLTEIARSASCNMAELEASCKYGFADVVLTRLSILSGMNLVVFVLIILLLGHNGDIGLLRLGLYLLTPFFLTCLASLFTLNRLRYRESVYICGSISCFVSIANTLLSRQYSLAFSDAYWPVWGMAFCILLYGTAKEAVQLVKRSEEMKWSLS